MKTLETTLQTRITELRAARNSGTDVGSKIEKIYEILDNLSEGNDVQVCEVRAALEMGRDEFDAYMLAMRYEGMVRLVAIGDRSRATATELEDGIQGECETFTKVEVA